MANKDTSNRGFASLDEDKQREIARKGGESLPAEKRSFFQDPELASDAGRKGGQQSQGGEREQQSGGGGQRNLGAGGREQQGGGGRQG